MNTLTLTEFQRVDNHFVKATYRGNHWGEKTHLSFNVNLIISTNMQDEENTVEATIDFDGKCSAKDIKSVFEKLADWCGRISVTVGACESDQLSLPLRLSTKGE